MNPQHRGGAVYSVRVGNTYLHYYSTLPACSSDNSSSLRVRSVTESSQRDSHAEQAGGV